MIAQGAGIRSVEQHRRQGNDSRAGNLIRNSVFVLDRAKILYDIERFELGQV